MTISERIAKAEKISAFLLGIEPALEEINDLRFPSANLNSALNYIKKAQASTEKEIIKMKKMKK